MFLSGKKSKTVYMSFFSVEEAKMEYIIESLKISVQRVPKTQLKEYQL